LGRFKWKTFSPRGLKGV